ncbi:hypothetical protein FOZ60_010100 [Perkinsus olseni]|uniref:OST-HTH associated domain-containing protein n=5 Tax=Perkinsus olseni TaxID=32597 RepID=A0A7J6NFX0_PEROL|nr:hypothetical protein FOZ60_010100 [Perkinsus olseni]
MALSTQSSSNHSGYYSSPTHYRGSRGRGGGGHERTALLEYGIPPAGSGDLARFCDKLIHGLYEQRIFPDLHNIKHRVAEIVLSRSGSHHLLHSGNRKNTWVSSPSLEKGMTRMIQYYAAPSQSNKYAVIADPRVTHTYREASPFPLIVDHAAPDAVALEAIFARITKNGQNCCVLFRETPVISPTFEGSFYFVSPHADDIYERRMWDEFRGYLDKALQDGRRDLYIFPKGRYSCAHALEARKLAFFKGLTMGHLINVVQLAMSKYNLLMFDEDKSIRPPQAAQKVIRSQQRKPSEDSKLYQRDGGPFIANLEELKFCLRVIFQIETSGSISMSNKNMISQYCHRQLSETKFGESRLSDLMARPELQDTVELVRTCGSTPWMYPRGSEEPTPQLLIRPAEGLIIPTKPLTDEVMAAWSRSRRLPPQEAYQHNRTKSPSGLHLPPALAGEGVSDHSEYQSSPTHASSSSNSMVSVMTPVAEGGSFGYSAESSEGSHSKAPWYHQMRPERLMTESSEVDGHSESLNVWTEVAADDRQSALDREAEAAALNDVLSQLAELVADELGPDPASRREASSPPPPREPAAAPTDPAQSSSNVEFVLPENSDELLLSPTKLSLLRELLELHDGTGEDDVGGLFVRDCSSSSTSESHQLPYSTTRFHDLD